MDLEQEDYNFLNSQTASVIISELAKEPSYSAKIADKHDKSSSAVRKIMSKLYSAGVVEKAERKKAQYYKVSFESMADFWLENIKYSIATEGSKEIFLNEDLFKQENKIKKFLVHYFEGAFTEDVRRPFSSILFEELNLNISLFISEHHEKLENNSFVYDISTMLSIKLSILPSFDTIAHSYCHAEPDADLEDFSSLEVLDPKSESDS